MQNELATRPARRPGFVLAAICALYLGLRGAILYTAFDQVALWAYEPYMCGTVARSLLAGGGEVPLAYFYDNAAGPVLMGAAVAPSFALFGASYLALKLVPLALGLGVLLVTWSLIKSLFGVRAAHLAALVVALAPATMTKYTLIGAGNHSENVFFTLLATWVFFRMHQGRVSASRLAACGLCAGWAFAIFIGALTPIALLALVHLGLRGLRRSLFDAPAALAGFAIGFAPVIWLNLGSGGRGLAFLAAKFGEESRERAPFGERLAEFFTTHLPASTTYPEFLGVSGRVADGLFLAATAAAFLLCAPSALKAIVALAKRVASSQSAAHELVRDAFVACAWAYLPLTALAYASSNLKIGGYQAPLEAGGYRYFLPHFAYAIVLIAVAAHAWSRGKHLLLKLAVIPLCAAPVLAGFANFALVDFASERTNVGASYEGHNFARVATTLAHVKLALPAEQVVAYADSYEPPLRARVYWGLGYSKALLAQIRREEPDLARILAEFPTARHADVARGVGTALRSSAIRERGVSSVSNAALLGWFAAREPLAEQVVEGLAFEWMFVTSTATPAFAAQENELFAAAPAELRPALARGIGHAAGRLLRREIEPDRAALLATLAALPPEFRAAMLDGLGAGLADGLIEARVTAFAVAHLAPSDARHVLAGFARRLREIWGELPASAELDDELPDEWRAAWAELSRG